MVSDESAPRPSVPGLLRTLAAELDERADGFGGQCPCAIHLAVKNFAADLAARYRTSALHFEQRYPEHESEAAA